MLRFLSFFLLFLFFFPLPLPADDCGPGMVATDTPDAVCVIENPKVLGLDGSVIGEKRLSGEVVDEDGNVIGQVEDDGRLVVDENGNVIGALEEKAETTESEW